MALKTKIYTIGAVDLPRAGDEVLREAGALMNAVAAERIPEDPPISFEAFAARVRNRPAMIVMRDWLARSADGQLVGRGFMARFEADTNKHFREVDVEVLPGHRRMGSANGSSARSSSRRVTPTTSCSAPL